MLIREDLNAQDERDSSVACKLIFFNNFKWLYLRQILSNIAWKHVKCFVI